MLSLFWTLAACNTGGSQDVSTTPPKPTTSVSADLVAGTWQVRMAVDANRAPYEGRQSWIAYFGGQRVTALQAFASENDAPGLARLHAEFAAAYRQAALVAAYSTVQVYGSDAQETDPAETSYLLGVSGALLGDAKWREKLGAAGSSAVKDLPARDAAWKKWADAGATWPPDEPAALSPGAPTGAEAAKTPDAGTIPHYLLPERVAAGATPGEGGPLEVKAGDPGTMWALARWHEKMAEQASPADVASVQLLVDPWRLPTESTTAPASVSYPDTFLFMSATTSAGDAAFFADLARDGAAAVDKHTVDSAYAVIVKKCTADEAGAKKVSVDCVLDEASALGQAIEEGMAKAAGREDSFHRSFADFARVGVLRAADRAAFAYGDTDAGGRLRINALDRATGSARDPLFLLSVAAWDAGNRNSVRAEELVHGLLTEVPGLEAARLPLDALHIRLSRNAAPGRPMH